MVLSQCWVAGIQEELTMRTIVALFVAGAFIASPSFAGSTGSSSGGGSGGGGHEIGRAHV